jgi:hypothetical protein
MNEREFATKIKEHLNFGTNRLDAHVSKRLRAARERALDAFQPEHAHAFHWAGAHGGHSTHKRHPALRRWLPLAILLAALGGAVYWQQTMLDDDDVDAALLGDDLPLNAYLDHGFSEWLDRSSQR